MFGVDCASRWMVLIVLVAGGFVEATGCGFGDGAMGLL